MTKAIMKWIGKKFILELPIPNIGSIEIKKINRYLKSEICKQQFKVNWSNSN